MKDYDYIITFDENGQPYIEHFSLSGAYNKARSAVAGVGRGILANHKYIAKIGNRYIYSAKELAAAKANQLKGRVQNAKTRASNTINNARNTVIAKGRRIRADVNIKRNNRKIKRHEQQEARKQRRAEMYNEVKLSTFLTGGEERKEYVRNKRATRAAERDVRKKRRAAERAARRAENIPKEYHGADAGAEGAKRRKEARDAQEALVRAAKIAGTRQMRTDDAERRYEETSAPGAIHKSIRKAKNTVNDFIDRLSSTPAYVAKNNTQNQHSGLKLETFGSDGSAKKKKKK